MEETLISVNHRNNIENACLYLFFILTIVVVVFNDNRLLFYARYAILGIGAFFGYLYCFEKKGSAYHPILFVLFIAVCWLLGYVFQDGYNNYPPADFFYTVFYIGLAVILLKNKYNHKITFILYCFLLLSILYKYIQVGDINSLLNNYSRNYISVLMLFCLLFYYLSCHDKGKKFFVFPVIIAFFISVFFRGRGGIVTFGFLAAALIILRIRILENKSARKLYAILLVVICVIAAFIIVNNSDALFEDPEAGLSLSRFQDKGMVDLERTKIWNGFLSNNTRSFDSFLLGSNTRLVRPEGNLHNSFLQSYASFGLIGFAGLIILIIRSFVIGIKRREVLWLILYSALLIRAFTDLLMFQGFCELFIYYFIFYWSINSLHKSNNQKD